MPTSEIHAPESFYHRVGKGRKVLSLQVWTTLARVLGEQISGVESMWETPKVDEDAWNILHCWVRIEFGDTVGQAKLKELAEAILAIFDNSAYVNPGDEYGVWILMPCKFASDDDNTIIHQGKFEWKQRRRRGDQQSWWMSMAIGEERLWLNGAVTLRRDYEELYRVAFAHQPEVYVLGVTPEHTLEEFIRLYRNQLRDAVLAAWPPITDERILDATSTIQSAD